MYLSSTTSRYLQRNFAQDSVSEPQSGGLSGPIDMPKETRQTMTVEKTKKTARTSHEATLDRLS